MPDEEPSRLYAFYKPPHGIKKPGGQKNIICLTFKNFLEMQSTCRKPNAISNLTQQPKRVEKICEGLLNDDDDECIVTLVYSCLNTSIQSLKHGFENIKKSVSSCKACLNFKCCGGPRLCSLI